MFGDRVAHARERLGLTQARLAELSGVSRQMVSAVEANRHLPRVDAGQAMAAALGMSVAELLDDGSAGVVGVLGQPLADGCRMRLSRVGDQLVAWPVSVTEEGWVPADGIMDGGQVHARGRPSGAVVVGCDPAIGLLSRTGERGPGIVAVPGSSAAGIESLESGRTHGAIVHGPPGALPQPAIAIRRVHLARWQVGLGGPAELGRQAFEEVLDGRRPAIQRDEGAGSQQALLRAVASRGATVAGGPLAAGHVAAARRAAQDGAVAVTIEPVAHAMGLAFHPLEVHVAQLWLRAADAADGDAGRLVEAITSPAMQRQLRMIAGYDLTDAGSLVT
ncbi:MAG: helix-turn-helix domain-containing protein [Euzebyales bacterium]|nr:helix-turn-helix domain-containing protein [Euzebyales bacterium]